jgi:hypothetical protein
MISLEDLPEGTEGKHHNLDLDNWCIGWVPSNTTSSVFSVNENVCTERLKLDFRHNNSLEQGFFEKLIVAQLEKKMLQFCCFDALFRAY